MPPKPSPLYHALSRNFRQPGMYSQFVVVLPLPPPASPRPYLHTNKTDSEHRLVFDAKWRSGSVCTSLPVYLLLALWTGSYGQQCKAGTHTLTHRGLQTLALFQRPVSLWFSGCSLGLSPFSNRELCSPRITSDYFRRVVLHRPIPDTSSLAPSFRVLSLQ